MGDLVKGVDGVRHHLILQTDAFLLTSFINGGHGLVQFSHTDAQPALQILKSHALKAWQDAFLTADDGVVGIQRFHGQALAPAGHLDNQSAGDLSLDHRLHGLVVGHGKDLHRIPGLNPFKKLVQAGDHKGK